jgi:hypothetical protein
MERHLGERKQLTQRILGQMFECGLVFGRNAFAPVLVEPAVFPQMQEADTIMCEQVEVDQKLDHMGSKDFLQRFDGEFGEKMEWAGPGKQAVGNGRMEWG